MIRTSPLTVLLLLLTTAPLTGAEPGLLSGEHRVLFLGDSITHSGHYISMVETTLRLTDDHVVPEIINLGLPSETACGLSEPSHPFPRPDVHERLERALSKLKPDVVFACYGMNDGIYYPFSQQRFETYQQGINSLIAKVQESGAKLVLMTPPPFDPLPLRNKGKLLPAGEEEYAWHSIYEDYDDVLEQYATWILQQSDRVEMVIDLRTPVNDFVQQQRKSDPGFTMSGDGVHLNPTGHRILADAILEAFGISPVDLQDETLADLIHQRQTLLHNAYLTHVGHQRPGMKDGLPIDEAISKSNELEQQISDRLIRLGPQLMQFDLPESHHVYFPASPTPGELSLAVDYYLWLPPSVKQLRGVIVHQHGCGDGASKGGVTAIHDLHWQALASKWDCALLGSSYESRAGVECRTWCDPRNGSADRFIQALEHFSKSTGHPEINDIPWCLWGHSGGGYWASLMQILYPERMVAIWLQSGTAYDRWKSGEIPPVKLRPEVFQVPVVACPGFKEKEHERFHVAWDGLLSMFQAYRAHDAPFIFAPDPKTGHECGDSRYLAIPFFDESLKLRLPDNPRSHALKQIQLERGLLANLDGTGLATSSDFTGQKSSAVWLPSPAFAGKWQDFITTGFVTDDTPPPMPVNVRIVRQSPQQCVLTWQAVADFESGIAGFRILSGDKLVAEIPQNPKSRFGRPLFQNMSYHDTPEQPLPVMQVTIPQKSIDTRRLNLVTVNSQGLQSEPASVLLD